MKRAVLVILAATSLVACNKKGPCDLEKLDAYFQLPADKALGGARSLCEYPRAIKTMLDNLDTASPEQRIAVVTRAVGEDISQLERICHSAVWVFRDLREEPAGHKVSSLIEGCKLTGLGLASRSEMLRASLADLMAAAMLYGWMLEKKVPEARRICRFMLGLE